LHSDNRPDAFRLTRSIISALRGGGFLGAVYGKPKIGHVRKSVIDRIKLEKQS
jgi:hypothetical protein